VTFTFKLYLYYPYGPYGLYKGDLYLYLYLPVNAFMCILNIFRSPDSRIILDEA